MTYLLTWSFACFYTCSIFPLEHCADAVVVVIVVVVVVVVVSTHAQPHTNTLEGQAKDKAKHPARAELAIP